MRRKQWMAGILGAALFLCIAVGSVLLTAAELEPLQEEVFVESTSEAEEVAPEQEGETEDENTRRLSEQYEKLYGVIKVEADRVGINLPELSEEDIKEFVSYVQMTGALLQSEDFRSLMSYTQVQELIEVVAKRTVDFFNEDRETAKKVLDTLGVDVRVIRILEVLARHGGAADRLVYHFNRYMSKQTITDEDMLAMLTDMMNDETIRNVVPEMIEAALFADDKLAGISAESAEQLTEQVTE